MVTTPQQKRGSFKMAAEVDSRMESSSTALMAGIALSKARMRRRKSSALSKLITNGQPPLSSPLPDKDDHQSTERGPNIIPLTPLTVPPSPLPPLSQNEILTSSLMSPLSPLPAVSEEREKEERGEEEREERENERVMTNGSLPRQEEDNQEGGTGLEVTGNHDDQDEQAAEDANPIIALIFTISRIHPLKAKLSLQSLAIRLSICDQLNESLLAKSLPDHCAVSYYERNNPAVNYILPIMSKPGHFTCDSQGSLQVNWKEEEAIFIEQTSHLFSPNTLLITELVQISHEAPPITIAWGQILMSRMPLGRELSVRLYRLPRKYRRKGVVSVSDLLREPIPSTTYPTVLYLSPVINDMSELMRRGGEEEVVREGRGGVLRSTTPIMPESSSERLSRAKLKASIHSISSLGQPLPQWTRLPGQPCLVPDTLCTSLSTDTKGCCTLSFSPSGRLLAVACESNHNFVVKIYQVLLGWSLVCTLPCDTGYIYKLAWSSDDRYVASASASGLCHVWCLTGVEEEELEVLLPHPSYVYCCEWVEKERRSFIVTGCYDGIIRCWSRNQMTHIVPGNISVNVLSYDVNESILYSADSQGTIKCWQIDIDRCSIQLNKSIQLQDYEGSSIRELVLLPWPHQLIVYTPKGTRPLTKLDMRIESVITDYPVTDEEREERVRKKGSSSYYAGISVSPCGSMLLAVVHTTIHIWDIINGKVLYQFPCPSLRSPGLVSQYHPYEHLYVCSGLGHRQGVIVLAPSSLALSQGQLL